MTDPSPALVAQWAACGIAAAAARFVPVPMLDDVFREGAVQVAVSRTLQAHGRSYPSDRLEPLWAGHDARGGFGRRVRSLSATVLFFPIRKYHAIFGAVRGVPTDVMRVLLLARTVDRRLDRGELAADTDPERLTAQACDLRRAVDVAMDRMDLRMLTAALADGLSQSRGLSSAAVGYARRWFNRPGTEPDLQPGGEVAESAQRISAVLRRPEIAQLLDRFDGQVDAALSSAR
jgi:hypothetical protein